MTKKLLFVIPLLGTVPLLLTGALRRPAPELPPAFLPQAIPLAPDVAPPGTTAAGLLDRAIGRLSPDRLQWLRVALWQRMAGPEVAFESEGTLQLGPKHCARLDVTVRSGGAPARWLVVCDGFALAHVKRVGDAAPVAVGTPLVPAAADGTAPPPTADERLRELGCGGPYPLLKDLRAKLTEVAAQTGLFRDRPVIRVQGRLAAGAATAVVADFCYLYLDAQSLWPARMEWWATDALRLELEFRDPQVNRPLSVEECIRAFSYRPDGNP